MSTFQDDTRELETIQLFRLEKDDSEGRSGVDAFLSINNKRIPFELKTTSNGSVTTVRDFGPDHIAKWINKHWLIGFFLKGKSPYYHYGSPKMMSYWINEKKEYISLDFRLSEFVSKKIGINDLYFICGQKDVYSYDDAYKIQKKQYKKSEYIELQDIKNGYTPEKMLFILQERAKYLVQRGSTLNNPHIPQSYFKEWEKITDNHAQVLRNLISL